ncbi:hypothetical protein Vafri_5099 [Volvox africanus]|uniref:Uncharacterized protein n=1 Tax=Volvox africanus TaxID=51714 RepID=A0A8J4EWP3_9CHLO|nr:hypothetical protein Vafri_5099 [Volvox africanus]
MLASGTAADMDVDEDGGSTVQPMPHNAHGRHTKGAAAVTPSLQYTETGEGGAAPRRLEWNGISAGFSALHLRNNGPCGTCGSYVGRHQPSMSTPFFTLVMKSLMEKDAHR